MFILLSGKDNYRLKRKLKEIVDYYKKKHRSKLSLETFDLNHPDFGEIRTRISQSPMFKEKKLIVFKDPFCSPQIEKKILKIVKNLQDFPGVLLFYQEKKVDSKRPLFQFFKKNGKVQQFPFLKGKDLKNWVQKEIEQEGGEIELPALKILVDYVRSDLWRMHQEIKKLVAFKKGEKISPKDVRLLVRPQIDTDIFKTLEAVAQGNQKKALNLIHQHLEKGDSPLYILSMINFQVRNLLIIGELQKRGNSLREVIKKSNLHPYVVKKNYSVARKFDLEKLKKIYQKIFQTDIDIKTGKVKPPQGLDLLVSQIY